MERRHRHRSALDPPTSLTRELPQLWLDGATTTLQLVARATGRAVAHVQQRPQVETAVKCAGGVAAALAAMRFSTSLRSACVVGLVTGVFAHSLYADVLQKSAATMAISNGRTPTAVALPRTIEDDGDGDTLVIRSSVSDDESDDDEEEEEDVEDARHAE